jgi:hypothetical protein
MEKIHGINISSSEPDESFNCLSVFCTYNRAQQLCNERLLFSSSHKLLGVVLKQTKSVLIK